jgi:predicted metal-dependent HD superfamily phosphohydrolase
MGEGPAGLDRARWTTLWSRLGAAGNGLAAFEQLAAAYAEPTRAYHTAAHINDCLDQLDRHRSLASHTDEVEAAIWFHDAVYVPGASDNEARSAELAAATLSSGGVLPVHARQIAVLVLATQHTTIPREPDAQLLCDIDLSILGRSGPVFDAYEQHIRREYAWVPEPLYRQARARILAEFLNRPSIYQTPALAELYESEARKNLQRALARL